MTQTGKLLSYIPHPWNKYPTCTTYRRRGLFWLLFQFIVSRLQGQDSKAEGVVEEGCSCHGGREAERVMAQ